MVFMNIAAFQDITSCGLPSALKMEAVLSSKHSYRYTRLHSVACLNITYEILNTAYSYIMNGRPMLLDNKACVYA
jgi:hypothetical protein